MKLQQDAVGNENKFLRKFVDVKGRRVLEVGCGEGRLTWKYARDARSVTAIDLDEESLRVAFIERPSDLAKQVHIACADSQSLPFAKETFDLAILAWSF